MPYGRKMNIFYMQIVKKTIKKGTIRILLFFSSLRLVRLFFLVLSSWLLLSAFFPDSTKNKCMIDVSDVLTDKYATIHEAQLDCRKITKSDSIVTFSKQLLGIPYVYGGTSLSGFDCSGFTYFVFRKFGISIPRCATYYDTIGKDIPLENCRKGDLILFRGTHQGDTSIGHVGIVVSRYKEPLRFIHASSSKMHFGVVETEYEKSGYPKRFIKIVRVL